MTYLWREFAGQDTRMLRKKVADAKKPTAGAEAQS
jgi:hypothetical protein